MKKTKLFSVLTVFAAMTLVACGGNNSANDKTTSAKPASTSQKPSSSQSKPSSSTPSTEWVDGAKTGKFTKQTRASDNGVAYLASVAEAEGWNDAETKMNKKKLSYTMKD